jgi:hypothetical protein
MYCKLRTFVCNNPECKDYNIEKKIIAWDNQAVCCDECESKLVEVPKPVKCNLAIIIK